jgi:signal peptidase I
MNRPAIAQSQSRSERKERGGFLRLLVLLVLATLAFRSFLFAPFTIPSDSMMPTLMRGDYLVAAKWPYGWSRWSLPFDVPLIADTLKPALPQRGDIAIFRHPVTHTEYIKRVIGLPGDTVALRAGLVTLNGAPVPRRRIADFNAGAEPGAECAWGAKRQRRADGSAVCRYARYRETLPGGRSFAVLDFGRTPQDEFAPVTVPQGHVFVLGDNRDNSQDSRFEPRPSGGVGMVSTSLLVGRFETVLFSTAGWPAWLAGGSRPRGIAS